MSQPFENSQTLPDYNPEQYLKQLLAVREAYHFGRLDDHPKSYDSVYTTVYLGAFGAIVFLSFTEKQWLIFTFSIVFLVMKVISYFRNGDSQNRYDEAIIQAHLNAGFTRTQATEFIYDQDWDDIQYDETRLDYLKEKIENAKNK